ncbi:hypothetical protein [Corynebacterium cystitidis]|uniref:hypothetical protein n=1 Tax=Corynebacterium cystitidis TaxID=35757 RepID=UPI00211E4396|nr:hypothetical protein [Corynebacterium cystitidis]
MPERSDSTISIGTVSGTYRYLNNVASHPHFLPVKWKHTKLPRSSFSQSTLNTLGSALTLFKVDNGKEEILDIFNGADSATRPPVFDWIAFYQELADTILPNLCCTERLPSFPLSQLMQTGHTD